MEREGLQQNGSAPSLRVTPAGQGDSEGLSSVSSPPPPARFVIGCSDEDFEESPENEEHHIIPPDGGWGWMVVAASFMCNVVVDGVIFTSGLLYPMLKETFDATNSEVAWISSLLGGFYLLVGPFVSSLANAFGFRLVCILGAVICVVACGLSYFATSIYYLYVSYGVLGGIGFGLIYVPAVIATGFYFEKRRALATGIAVCGSGIGTFILSPMTTLILGSHQENWQVVFLAYGGVVATCIVYALAFRPLSASTGKKVERGDDIEEIQGTPLLIRIKRARDRELAECPSAISMGTYSRTSSKVTLEEAATMANGDLKSPTGSFSMAKALLDRHGGGAGVKRQSFPGIHLMSPSNTIIEEAETNPEENNGNSTTSPKNSEESSESPRSQTVLDDNKNETASDKNHLSPDSAKTPAQLLYPRIESAPTFTYSSADYQRRHSRRASRSSEKSRPFYRDDIFYSGSLMRLHQYKSTETVEQYHASVTHFPEAEAEEAVSGSKCCPVASSYVLKRIFDFSLLRSITFVMLGITGFMALLALFVPFNFLPSYAKDLGVEVSDISFMMALIGICNTAGRIVAGWISDHPKVDVLLVNNLALIIGGGATIVLPFLTSLSLLYGYCVVFGLCIAAFASLRSILLVELLGLEKLTNAFGLLLLFQGFAALFGSPIAGAFVDLTGEYKLSFYVFGAIFALSGILCIPLRRIKEWEEERIDQKLRNEKYGLK